MRFRGKKPIFNYDDTWSLDMTLAPIIFEGLKKYKEVITSEDNCAGFPGRLYGSCDFGYTVEDGDEELAQQTWYRILDEMISAFDGYDVINDDSEDRQKGIELFAKYFTCLWW